MPIKELGRKKLRRAFQAVVVTIMLLLGVTIYLGYITSKTLRQSIHDQYNDQQLFLARSTANMIQSSLESAVYDLILLNSMTAIQYSDHEAYETLVLSVLPVLNRDNISELHRVDRNGETLFIANEQGITMQHRVASKDAAVYLSWAKNMANRGRVMAADARRLKTGRDARMVMDLVIPTYEDSVHERHPRPSHRFAGYLRATLDINSLLQQVVQSIRSGETGHAWVMDPGGVILFHPEAEYIGEEIFSLNPYPDISLPVKDFRQNIREKMLKGQEGTGTYLSRWQNKTGGPEEKLFAFTPVRIQNPFADIVWSVAVAVPALEVEGTVSALYQRQLVFQGAILLMVILMASIVYIYQLRWTTILEHEVTVKTGDIKHYAEQLKRSEAKYRTLVESAQDLIFTVTPDGVISTANQHMQTILGLRESDLVGKNLSDFTSTIEAEKQMACIEEVFGQGKGRGTESLWIIGDNEYWFNVQYMPLKDPEYNSRTILGIARDITETRRIEKQLTNTEKLASLGTMAAGVAHEINNPLGIILGFCELLQEKIRPDTEEYNDLKTIEKKGLHCKAIVESLLSFARVSDESEPYCDLNLNIKEILSILRHSLDKRNIRLATDLDNRQLIIRADSRGVQQVLLNLINNAIQAMDETGGGDLVISSSLSADGGHAVLTVQDTGTGIPTDIMENIFDPFFTTKRIGQGTGLGLSVTYGIVSKYHGTITCESLNIKDHPDSHGSTFIITLPLDEFDLDIENHQ